MVSMLLEEFSLSLVFVMLWPLLCLDLSSSWLEGSQYLFLELVSTWPSSLLCLLGLLQLLLLQVCKQLLIIDLMQQFYFCIFIMMIYCISVVYVLAALWGIGDAIWQTQINALYGVLFASDEEAAFSNYRLWESMGFLLAFITQACGVCVFPKLILTIVFLSLGMGGYFVVEFLERKKAQERRND